MNQETISEYVNKHVVITVDGKTIYCQILSISRDKMNVRDEHVKYHTIFLITVTSLTPISRSEFYDLPSCEFE